MTTTKLTSTKTTPKRRTQVWLDERADRYLSAALVAYTTILGRPVSCSLIIRRGLKLLADHLRRLDSVRAKEAEADLLIRSTR